MNWDPAVLGDVRTCNRRAVSSPRSSQLRGKAREHRWAGPRRGARKSFANTNQQNSWKLQPVISIFLQAPQQTGMVMRDLKDVCNSLVSLRDACLKIQQACGGACCFVVFGENN